MSKKETDVMSIDVSEFPEYRWLAEGETNLLTLKDRFKERYPHNYQYEYLKFLMMTVID